MSRALLVSVAASLVLAVSVQEAPAETIRVPGDRSTLQEGLDAANDGDTVLVAPGEYVIERTLVVRGTDRAGAPREVILRSEAGPGATIIRLSDRPIAGELGSVVALREGLRPGGGIAGFTITGGIGSFVDGSLRGGGILCDGDSSPTISDCRILENRADAGGGAYCKGGAPVFRGCVVARNQAQLGGGIFTLDSRVQVLETQVASNSAIQECRGGTCLGGTGGGLNITTSGSLGASVSANIVACLVEGNSAEFQAGGLGLAGAFTAVVDRCVVRDNFARDRAGGVQGGTRTELHNCVVSANRSNRGAGTSGPLSLDHCTVVANVAGGGVVDAKVVTSSIVWGNGGGSLLPAGSAGAKVSHSCVESPEPPPGEGNVALDPRFCATHTGEDLFVDAAAESGGDGSAGRPWRDLRSALVPSLVLSRDSPCLGAAAEGSDMGAATGPCDAPGPPIVRRLHIAPGRYSVEGLVLAGFALVQGAGDAETFLVGTVSGVTGRLEGVTVTGGRVHGGLVVGDGEAPEFVDVSVESNTVSGERAGGGVRCEARSRPAFQRCAVRLNSAYEGGGVYCGELCEATFTDCLIADNHAFQRGGGLVSDESLARLEDCTLLGNDVEGQNGEGGGAWVYRGSCLLVDCVVAQNISELGAGVSGPATLVHCTLTANGGAETIRKATLLDSCIVWGNDGPSFGYGDDGPLSVVYSCVAGGAGALLGETNISRDPLFCGWGERQEVYVDAVAAPGGDGTVDAPFRALSRATEPGLGLAALSPCLGAGAGGTNMGADRSGCAEPDHGVRVVRMAEGCYHEPIIHVSQGVSLLGAGREATVVEGSVLGLQTGAQLADLTVTGSVAHGGVRVAPGARATLLRVRVAGNLGMGNRGLAGGVTCGERSSTLLEDCVIEGNRGWFAGGVGGGEGASLTLRRCRVVGNASQTAGGGVRSQGGSSVSLENCVVAGNAANFYGEGQGGAIFAEAERLDLVNCTIVANAVIQNAFSYAVLGGDSTSVVNTILWDNSTLEALVADERRLDLRASNVEGRPPGGGNLALEPRFVSPGQFDFGRFREAADGDESGLLPDFIVVVPDLHPAHDSPTIDAGTPVGAPAVDLEAFERPCWEGFDLGALEYCGSEPPARPSAFLRGDVDGDGRLQLGDAVFFLRYFFLGAEPPGCLDAADADDSGELNIGDAIFSLTYQFLGGVTVPEPRERCGADPTFDRLECHEHKACK